MIIAGSAGSSPNQSFSYAGGLCLQNLRAWQEVGEPHHLHHVPPHHQLQHLDAAVLYAV